MPLFLVVAAVPVLGVVLAVVWWVIRGRRVGLPAGVVALFTAIASVLALVADMLARLIGLPGFQPPVPVLIWFFDYRYTVPLVVGIIALALLAVPLHARRGVGAADLEPRSMLTFTRGRWLAAPAAVLALIGIITVAAGVASQPDAETGRYDSVMVDAGVGAIATSIYGWFYSTPALVALVMLVGAVCVDLFLIARPPLGEDRELDVRTRRIRSRNVLTAATGAMLLHLAAVFASLSATASVQGEFATSEGPVFLWSPIAGFQVAFTVAAYAVGVAGIASWATVALAAVPVRRHALVPAAA